MTPEETHDALHRALLALGKGDAPAIKAARDALEGLQIAALRGDARVPLVVLFTQPEALALAEFHAMITNDVSVAAVARYLVVDGLASETGADLVPRMED